MISKPTYKPFGEQAILIEWEQIISDKNLKEIVTFKSKLEASNTSFLDLILGYNSLTVIYKHQILKLEVEVEKLERIYISDELKKTTRNYIWEIPVCYHKKFGLDLDIISEKNKLSVSKIIELHTAPIYTVFFIGFLPGFPYLSGLDKRLFIDRKPNPRLKVKKGTVAIGGKQTGMYPQETAGGWNIIGNTPINLFNVNKEKPCLLSSGDKIKFTSISIDEYENIEYQIINKTYILKPNLVDD